MTLKEKFENVELNLSECPYEFIGTEASKQCEQIADDFAIGFKDWCDKFTNEVGDWKQDGVCLKNRFSTKELLEIYKKEKQL